uniref:Uncharacterized protein n=1 Tax=Oryza rufipogon TaxID=4529 RepID=A0A0E0QUZ4_ORYRU
MATAFPYSFTRTKHLTLSPPSSHGGDAADHRPLPWILLDVRAYIADRRNSTTATIVLSNGRKIQITFCIAPPPLVSYICAWLQEVSVYDAERIVNDFDYAYTHSTISQYFTTAAAGLKRNLKRPLKFHMQYPHKRQGGPGSKIRDETEDGNNPMELD